MFTTPFYFGKNVESFFASFFNVMTLFTLLETKGLDVGMSGASDCNQLGFRVRFPSGYIQNAFLVIKVRQHPFLKSCNSWIAPSILPIRYWITSTVLNCKTTYQLKIDFNWIFWVHYLNSSNERLFALNPTTWQQHPIFNWRASYLFEFYNLNQCKCVDVFFIR